MTNVVLKPNGEIDASSFPADRLTFVHFHDDDSYSAYAGPVWLCNEPTKEEASKEAAFLITCCRNGVEYVRENWPGLWELLCELREKAVA